MTKHIWQAEKYHHNSTVQNEAAAQLLQYIQLQGNEQILDIGCGDGKITAMIASNLPKASVVGIDSSPQMIDFSRRIYMKNCNSNLDFLLQDIENINYSHQYNFVCSFFALQWVSNLDSVFGKIYQSLKQGGIFAFTIPLHISLALEQTVQELITLPEWSNYFQNFSPGWNFYDPKEIQNFLKSNQFKINRIDVVPHEVLFSSRTHLEQFILPWFSYLNQIPDLLKDKFSKQIFDRYLELEPTFPDGSISYKYLRIESVAEKPISISNT